MSPRSEPPRADAASVAELAAGGVVRLRRTGEVLALHEREEDRWGFPKGHVEPGESVLDAARREITEESGLSDLTFERELAVVAYRFFALGRRVNVYKTVVYWLVETGERDVRLEPIFDRSLWSRPEELAPRLKYETDREVLRALLGSPPRIRSA